MRPYCRRMLAGLAAIAMAGPVAGQSAQIRGTVAYADGTDIPKGVLAVEVTPASAPGHELRLDSDGRSKTIAFSVPADGVDKGTRIVAYLERADGWLLARGSATDESGTVRITLFPAMH